MKGHMSGSGAAITRRRVLGAGSSGAVAAMAGVALAACAPGGEQGQGKAKQLTGEVHWLSYNVPGTRNAELRQKGLDGLSQKFPGPKVVLDLVGTTYTGPYLDKIKAAIASDTAPDVFLIADYDIPNFIGQKAVLNLDPLVRRDKYDLSDFSQETISFFRHKGGLYGMPDNTAIIGWYANNDLFRKPAWRRRRCSPTTGRGRKKRWYSGRSS